MSEEPTSAAPPARQNGNASIRVERDYRIKWMTPGASRICNIGEADIGRNIILFPLEGLGENLIEDTESVLRTLLPKERQLELLRKSTFLRRIQPAVAENDGLDGVIISYIEVGESEAMADALQALSESFEARVRVRTKQLRHLTAELALTEERERRELAQDLHDGLGQFLAILKMKMTSIKENERRGTLKCAFREIEGLIDQANQSVRTLMTQLSPPVLQALGLTPALDWLAEEMERVYKLEVHLQHDGPPIVLEEPAKTTIFRAVRELLINVAKHTHCNEAWLISQVDAQRVSISVSDKGPGFSYDAMAGNGLGKSGFGLNSIKDRIEYIGGEMAILSTPGDGTTITIVFPTTTERETPAKEAP